MITVGVGSWYRRLVKGASPPYAGASVPCGDCVSCCTHVKIDLYPPHDDPALFETHTDANGRVTLAQQDDGSCWYLRDTKCTIYDRRPATCRSFDCRALLATDVQHPVHIWTAARERFELQVKAPGDRELLWSFQTKARLLEAHHPERSPAVIVQQALTP